jgi:hypothetical protein
LTTQLIALVHHFGEVCASYVVKAHSFVLCFKLA